MTAQGRILAIDWGRRRIGLALSDELGLSSRGLATLERTYREADLASIERIVRENDVQRIVIGRPLHLDGRRSAASREAERFGKTLGKRCQVELILWDERLTSVEAQARLRAERPGAKIDKAAVDQMSARVILESYLHSLAES